MIALDKNGWPRHPSPLLHPDRKVARTLVMTRCLVDPARIGPDPKIAYVQDIVEASSKRCLELEHIVIKTVHCSMNVVGGTDNHRHSPSSTQTLGFDLSRRIGPASC